MGLASAMPVARSRSVQTRPAETNSDPTLHSPEAMGDISQAIEASRSESPRRTRDDTGLRTCFEGDVSLPGDALGGGIDSVCARGDAAILETEIALRNRLDIRNFTVNPGFRSVFSGNYFGSVLALTLAI